MKPRRLFVPTVKLAVPALTALALLLALPKAWPQGLGGQAPAGLVSQDQLKAAQAEADKLRSAVKAAQDKAASAEAAALKADERARLAAQTKPAGVPPEQLDALRKERDAARTQRDTALAEAEALQTQIKQAQAEQRRGASAAKNDGALRTDRDRLKRDNQAQQERISTLQAELADKDKALLAARQAQRAAQAAANTPAPSPTRAAPAVAAPAPAAAATLPTDGTELVVASCGAACPSFVLIPNPGATVLGTGAEAITARFNYRFAMAKTEVTLGQYWAFMKDSKYQPVKTDYTYCNWNDAANAKDDRLPVDCVNTQDAQAYARWFTERYGKQLGVRLESIGLPTELEWEFSARGGRNTQAYLWADDASKAETCRHAHTANCPRGVLPVGGRLPNGFGLDDMIGNVWEWTATDWREDRKSMEANLRDHANDSTGVSAARAVLGPSFGSDGDWLRLASRYRYSPGIRSSFIGFRLVARIAP